MVTRLKGRLSQSGEILARNRSNMNLDNYRQMMSNIDWTELYSSDDINLANDCFEKEVIKILDTVAPLKVNQIRSKHKAWVTRETRQLMDLRDKTRAKAQTSKSEDDWSLYKSLRNKCSANVKSDKANHFRKLYDKHDKEKDSRNLYQLTKNQLGWKNKGPPTSLVIKGKLFTAPRDIAEQQQIYFKEKVETLQKSIPPPTADPLGILKTAMGKWSKAKDRTIFTIKEVSLLDTVKVIKQLGNSTAFGHDKLDAMSIKLAATSLFAPLNFLVNLSIRKQTFANKWKIGRVVPVHKEKGVKENEVSSYRPISLLSVTGKIVEKIVQKQMLEYLEESEQINDKNNAYRRHHSTTSAVIAMTEALFEATDHNMIATVMTIDKSCAFDSVEHEILLEKLRIYNFGSAACNWLRSYLSYRSQYVSIGSKNSSMNYVKIGVPQGSVLGPILYTMFVNELPAVTKDDICRSSLHQDTTDVLFGGDCLICGIVPSYADDATVISASHSRDSNQLKITENLRKIQNFLSNNRLVMNGTKTKLVESMVAQKRAKTRGFPPKLVTRSNTGENKLVIAERQTRILGCEIPDNLTWKPHIISGSKPLIKDLRKTLGGLKHLSRQLPLNCRRKLVTGLMQSKAAYLSAVWGGATSNHMRKLQTVMNSAARFSSGLPKRTRASTLMASNGWLSIRELATYHTALAMHNMVWKKAPLSLYKKISLDNDFRISTNRPRLQITEAGLRWRGTKLWNSLELDIRSQQNKVKFKKAVKTLIISRRDTAPGQSSQAQQVLDTG